MDVSFVIRRRLDEFGLEQRDLAQAAQLTESNVGSPQALFMLPLTSPLAAERF